jgi:tetratricopeptide (TPR) repeat protein
MARPLCFVLMPFGRKPTIAGATVDFDAVYHEFIKPAVTAAGLEPLRADEEQSGGIIHKPMFERLVLCEYAVADLTTANANVFYELGVRHAILPRSTVLLFASSGTQLPFDVAPLRALPYALGADGKPASAEADQAALVNRLAEAKSGTDSPLFQLLEGYPDIQHLKTDVFREQVQYTAKIKADLAAARDIALDKNLDKALEKAKEAVRAVETGLGDFEALEAGALIDLLLSYRAVEGWPEMIAVARRLPAPIAATVLVQEQLAFALNRNKQGEEAERTLKALIESRGPSSETYGLLGRIYKDRWGEAAKRGEQFLTEGLLDGAIEAYQRGFEADWRDAYPGVNAVTLMELKEPPDPQREALLPVVSYAVERRIASGKPNYWDYATRLELAVLARNERTARAALAKALTEKPESWMKKSTGGNLNLISDARAKRGEETPPWLRDMLAALTMG